MRSVLLSVSLGLGLLVISVPAAAQSIRHVHHRAAHYHNHIQSLQRQIRHRPAAIDFRAARELDQLAIAAYALREATRFDEDFYLVELRYGEVINLHQRVSPLFLSVCSRAFGPVTGAWQRADQSLLRLSHSMELLVSPGCHLSQSGFGHHTGRLHDRSGLGAGGPWGVSPPIGVPLGRSGGQAFPHHLDARPVFPGGRAPGHFAPPAGRDFRNQILGGLLNGLLR